MKNLLIFLLILGLVMVATNPTNEDFNYYVFSQDDDEFGQNGSAEVLVRYFFDDIISASYKRDNYYIFSTYKVSSFLFGGPDNDIYIGVFKNFFQIDQITSHFKSLK